MERSKCDCTNCRNKRFTRFLHDAWYISLIVMYNILFITDSIGSIIGALASKNKRTTGIVVCLSMLIFTVYKVLPIIVNSTIQPHYVQYRVR